MPTRTIASLRRTQPRAVVLGTNEIASAVAVHLWGEGFAVVLSHDPDRPVIRRAMAYHDVLFGEEIVLDGVPGFALERALDLVGPGAAERGIAVTALGLVDLLPMGPFAVLVDARMNEAVAVPDLRHLAYRTIGLGPGFAVGRDCDAAIDTARRPALDPLRIVVPRGGEPAEEARAVARILTAPQPGRWRTSLAIGTRVFKGMIVGHLDRLPVSVPIDGVLAGLARDGAEIPAGAEIVEIDGRGRWRARWSGIDVGARSIALATTRAAVLTHAPTPPRRTDVS